MAWGHFPGEARQHVGRRSQGSQPPTDRAEPSPPRILCSQHGVRGLPSRADRAGGFWGVLGPRTWLRVEGLTLQLDAKWGFPLRAALGFEGPSVPGEGAGTAQPRGAHTRSRAPGSSLWLCPARRGRCLSWRSGGGLHSRRKSSTFPERHRGFLDCGVTLSRDGHASSVQPHRW